MVGIAPDEKYEMHFSCRICKWRSVQEELPPEDLDVIIYHKNGLHVYREKIAISSIYITEGPRYFWKWQYHPTYWMPLPGAPKEDE